MMKHVFIMSLNTSPLVKSAHGQLRHDSGSPVIKTMKIQDPGLYSFLQI